MAEKQNGGCPVDHENMTAEDYAKLPLPPGSDGLPLVGETLTFISDPAGFGATMREKFGAPFYANVLGDKTVFFNNTEANRWIFKGENDYLENAWSNTIASLLGQDSVSMLTGDDHKQRRKILNPYFRYERMNPFIPTIQAAIEAHLANWANQEFVTLSMVNRAMTFEIIARYIFGEIEGLPIETLREDFRIWTGGIISLGINLPFTRYGQSLKARERLWATLTEIVRDYQQRDLGDCVLKDLFAIRDDNDQALSVDTIVDEIQVLLFAGHDTTVAALTNTFILLAQYPNVLTKGREVVANVTPDMLKDARGLGKLPPYIDAIINESLRMYAPVTGSFRKMTEDRCFEGYKIPKGWAISVAIGNTHHNENLWGNHTTFDPERFLRDEHKKENLMFIPFGGGPRMCLGMNFALVTMRLALIHILKHYEWSLLPNQDLSMQIIPTPLPKSGGLATFRQL